MGGATKMKKKRIVSLRTYAEIAKSRNKRRLSDTIGYAFVAVVLAYFGAHLAVAFIKFGN
jgi:hypothetical protein